MEWKPQPVTRRHDPRDSSRLRAPPSTRGRSNQCEVGRPIRGVASHQETHHGVSVVERTHVERAIQGDEDAYESLITVAGDRLLAIAFRILRDLQAAEDAVQDTLVSAWRGLPALRDPERFEAWLTRLLVRACYAEARRHRSWSIRMRVLPIEGPEGPDPTLSIADRDQLDRGFKRLPIDQRAIFIMHHYLGWTHSEIAETLAIPIGTAKSRLYYATQTLRAALEADARTVSSAERTA
jgi:RNA polymerase sigma-70 factor (ECF subfamily)